MSSTSHPAISPVTPASSGGEAVSGVPAIPGAPSDNPSMTSRDHAASATRTVKVALPIGIPGAVGFLAWARNGAHGRADGDLVAEALRRAGIGKPRVSADTGDATSRQSRRSRWLTPDRFRLPTDVADAAESLAEATGRSLDDVIADALAEQLPDMIAEALRVVLPASVRRARPIDMQAADGRQLRPSSFEQPEFSP